VNQNLHIRYLLYFCSCEYFLKLSYEANFIKPSNGVLFFYFVHGWFWFWDISALQKVKEDTSLLLLIRLWEVHVSSVPQTVRKRSPI